MTDPQRALRTVSTPELLAELAARIAALEARAADRPLPRGIVGTRAAVSWRTVDELMLAQGTPRCPHCRHDGDWWDTTTATPTPDPAGVNRNA